MSEFVLEVSGLCKSFDGIHALAEFSLAVGKQEIRGLIGPNGAGKTTLFNIVSGLISPDRGRVILNGRDVTGAPPHAIAKFGLGRTFQNVRLIRQISVLDNVLLSSGNQPGERLTNVFFFPRKSHTAESTIRKEAMELLSEIGLINVAGEPAEDLSFGQQKLLTLACCIASKADMLLLDEPVSGISPEMIDKILQIIAGLPETGRSVILIEHNLDAVRQVCGRVVFMDAGVKVSEGTPQQVSDDPKVTQAYMD